MTSAPAAPGGHEEESALHRVRRRVRVHVQWARTQGIGRLVEEDQLDPVQRLVIARRKRAWRRRHGVDPGHARAVFLLGVQRSGTNMLVRGLEMAGEVQVHNENDRRAFRRFRLRSDEEIAALVKSSRHSLVLFKPLCDSHRGPELLDNLPLSVHPRVVWAYRDVDGRTKSALAKFGDANLRVLSEIATGRGLARWQAQRLSTETLEFIRSFDYSKMTPATASALFWYARNMLLFELKLAGRPDVFVSSYDALVEDPATTITALCDFLGFPYRPQLHAHIAVRSAPSGAPAELSIDPRVRERCAEITTRLEAAAAASRARAQAA